MANEAPKPTTTDAGIPVPSDEHSLTVGADGPILLQDHYLIEQMANFNRERIPERQPHAKGGGAFGCFEVTDDVSRYTKAAVFQPGTRTDTLQRFSTVAGERGSPDTWRDPRGFSIKFYSTAGNYDMVGNNTPVFFIRDPMKFQHFIRSQKRRADSNLRDHDMQWDFWTLSPESAHQVAWLMGDRGIPKSWRHMNGYSSHTYMWVNAGGERFWVKYHFKTDQGIDFLTQDDADKMAGQDSDYHVRDLHNAIANVLTYNNSVENFPNNMIAGIGPSPDKMLQGRMFAYADAHRARMGVNYKQIPVNRPKVAVNSYSKDGAMRIDSVTDPVYAPNSKGGPAADGAQHPADAVWSASGEFMHAAYTPHKEDDDFGQAGTLVREVMDDAARERLVSNVSGHLLDGVSEPVLARAFEYWRNIDEDIGARIEKAVRKG